MRCHRRRQKLFFRSLRDERIGSDFPPRHHNVNWQTPFGAVAEGAGGSAVRRSAGTQFPTPALGQEAGPGMAPAVLPPSLPAKTITEKKESASHV